MTIRARFAVVIAIIQGGRSLVSSLILSYERPYAKPPAVAVARASRASFNSRPAKVAVFQWPRPFL